MQIMNIATPRIIKYFHKKENTLFIYLYNLCIFIYIYSNFYIYHLNNMKYVLKQNMYVFVCVWITHCVSLVQNYFQIIKPILDFYYYHEYIQ
jgi:hypothetical protein